MARLVSELGADVIDDTVVEKQSKLSPKKRNLIIGFSVLGIVAIAISLIYYFAINVWLYDYETMPYISYAVNVTPDEDGIFAGQITASIQSVSSNSKYPSTFKIPRKIKGYPITRIDDSAFQGCTRLKKVIMTDNIVSVGEKAFINCTSLESFKFSKNLTSIGDNAFEGTPYKDTWDNYAFFNINNILLDINETKLLADYGKSSIIFVNDENSENIAKYPDSLAFSLNTLSVVGDKSNDVQITEWMDGLFTGFRTLKLVECPSYLTEIPISSFSNCTALEEVVLANENTSILENAFDGCTSLETINFVGNESITSIGNYAFRNTDLNITSLPSKLSNLGDYAFYGCDNITSIIIPSTLSKIPNYAFYNTSLSSIDFEDESLVTSIGDYAFFGAEFTTFTFPKNMATVSKGVLANNENLTSVSVYENGLINRINAGAFANNSNFTSLITLNDDGTPARSEEGTVYLPKSMTRTYHDSDEGTFENTAIKKIVIPETITKIAERLCYNCKQLETVEFLNPGQSVLRSIDGSAFRGCSSLTSIEIPNLVNAIGTYAFEGCTSLTSAKLPNYDDCTEEQVLVATENNTISPVKYTTVKEYIFAGCTALSNVTIPNTITKLANYCFKDCTSLKTILIPQNVTSIAAYAFSGSNIRVIAEIASKPATWGNNWNVGVIGTTLGSKGTITDGNFLYSINADDSLTLVAFNNDGATTSITLTNSVTIDSTEYTISAVSEGFVYDDDVLTSVTISANIPTVAGNAFNSNCENLTSITVSDASSEEDIPEGWDANWDGGIGHTF